MKEAYSRYAVFTIGGVALGALGTLLVGRKKDKLRPAVADLISRGLDVKDKTLAMAETAKEQLEDIVAEAEDLKKRRNTSAIGSAPAGSAD